MLCMLPVAALTANYDCKYLDFLLFLGYNTSVGRRV